MSSSGRVFEVRLSNEEIAIDYDVDLKILGAYVHSDFYAAWLPIDLSATPDLIVKKFIAAVKLDDEIKKSL